MPEGLWYIANPIPHLRGGVFVFGGIVWYDIFSFAVFHEFLINQNFTVFQDDRLDTFGEKKSGSMMLISNKIRHLAIIAIFYCLSSLWAIISFSGCNGNIPTASKLVSGKVIITWNEVPGVKAYNIYGSTSPGVTKLGGYKFRNAPNPFKMTQLEPGKTYYFVVTVVTNSGESEESKELSYTAVMDKVGFIDFKDLFDNPIKDDKSGTSKQGEVTLAWDNVPNATSYNIYWNDSPGVTKFNGKKISNVKNPYTLKGLKPGTYYFVVTAVNEFGESGESTEYSFSVVD